MQTRVNHRIIWRSRKYQRNQMKKTLDCQQKVESATKLFVKLKWSSSMGFLKKFNYVIQTTYKPKRLTRQAILIIINYLLKPLKPLIISNQMK